MAVRRPFVVGLYTSVIQRPYSRAARPTTPEGISVDAISRRRFFTVAGAATAGALGLAATAATAFAAPESGFDPTVWREYGDPLVGPTGVGPLTGDTVAVKDLYTVAGHVVGAGNEVWLAEAPVATSTAPAVEALLAAGAAVAGISRTDELAYSLAGTNGHYGTPPNPAAPERIPGGSSSGSASAVSLGQATIGLGTDTGGSIRIPSSYQGLYGIRTTHGVISRDGLIPLAPSFDTVGWMTRTRTELVRVAAVLEPDLSAAMTFPRAVYADSLIALADAEVGSAIRRAITGWSSELPIAPIDFDASQLPLWVKAFQTRQGWEAWQAHGTWIERHWESLNPDVRSRFEAAAKRTPEELADADRVLGAARAAIDGALGDAVLILPSASSVAPPRDSAALGGDVIEDIRARTFQLTCLAGITGRPAVSSPLPVTGPPIGICAVGPLRSDRALAGLQVNGS
ncbi:amidase family protein [Mycobacterium sp. ITM-2016-00317]|uniref:amidase family protein n=1 Tax=Mycobacterium sp. ITM-2016-00317 TaxID=2099694 RepID=UPI00287F7E32|nr:amidase family protein [Mycobacterium sp. ITM-2016-00317]WNG86471.1 amidase family protein [Mycobacterium sp. ITM-2016-00317]